MATTQLNRVNQRFQPTPRHDGGIHTQSLTATTTRLVIVGESNLSVAGLAGILEAQHKSTLVACLKPEEDCLEKLVAARPDALLIQHESLPQTLEAFMGEVQHQAPDTPILLFGKAMDDNHLYKLVRAGIGVISMTMPMLTTSDARLSKYYSANTGSIGTSWNVL